MTDGDVLAYLGRRWARRLDATTVQQAQDALALARSDAQRRRVFDRLVARPALWRGQARYGESPASLTLAPVEKLLARRVAAGEPRDVAAAALGLDAAGRRRAEAMLRHTGVLRGRGGAVADPGGVGLNFHVVLAEGEPAFSVH